MAKPSPGQPLPRSAMLWGNIIESTDDYVLRRRLGQAGGVLPGGASPAIIKVKNSSGAARRAGDILQLSSSLVTTLDAQHLWLDGVAPAAPTFTAFHGVLLEAAPTNAIVRCQVSGVCRAYVDVAHADHMRCDVTAADYQLQSVHAGPYQILQKPSGTGELLCVVLLGPKRPSSGIAKLSGTLSAGSTSSITSATAAMQKRSSTSFATANQNITVYSYYATAFATNDFINVAQDDQGDWWMTTKDCS